MSLTDDPNHPDLGKRGPDGQNEAYLVLSEEERAQGFIRPPSVAPTRTWLAGRRPRWHCPSPRPTLAIQASMVRRSVVIVASICLSRSSSGRAAKKRLAARWR